MRGRGLSVCALCLVGLLVMAGSSGATTTGKKQRVMIEMKERKGWGTWELTTLTSGPITFDGGKYTWKMHSRTKGVIDGQGYERYAADVTYVGKTGTWVARETGRIVSASIGKSVVTGEWKILRGTDAYARVKGSGRLAAALGIVSPDPWRYEGFMVSP